MMPGPETRSRALAAVMVLLVSVATGFAWFKLLERISL